MSVRRRLDENGRVVEEAEYAGRQRQGTTRMWSPEGVLLAEAEYNAGRLHGRSRSWYENGQLHIDAFYVNNKLDGPYLSYWHDGTRKEVGSFKADRRVGTYCWFDVSGRLIQSKQFLTPP